MNKHRNHVTEIMDLTLKIIYLLTGEDYIFEKKHFEHMNDQHESEESCNTGSPSSALPLQLSMPESDNDKKILLLTNKITHLLSGEVWQYLEGHNDLYKNMKIETNQSLRRRADEIVGNDIFEGVHTTSSSMDCLTENERYSINNVAAECSNTNNDMMQKGIQESDVRGAGNDMNTNVCKPIEKTQTEYRSTRIKEESASCEERNLTNTDINTPKEHTQTEYRSTHIKEESASCEAGVEPDMYTDTAYTQADYQSTFLKEQSFSCEGHLTETDAYTPIEYIQAAYLSTSLKEESTSSEDVNPTAAGCYIPTEHAQCRFPGTDYNKVDTIREGNTIQPIIDCRERGINFNDESVHAAHSRIHTMNRITSGAKSFLCTKCNVCFTHKKDLVRHQRTHTGEKPFLCSECGKSFTRNSTLVRHKKIHTGEKPFSCSECHRSFSQKSHLIVHYRVHTGEKPFHCEECGKMCNSKAELVRHQRAHTGDKPFSCSVCGRCFADKSALVSHQRIHTGEKPFACSVCGKHFAHTSTLLKHKTIHTDDKPFSCSVCGKCFAQKADVIKHHMIHTGEKPFACSVCGKHFTCNTTLLKHVTMHYAIDQNIHSHACS
ncbi:oocyte zinc finger protein XlCOF7.1-like [Pelobates fuscus]|uniref:oocyte zinc finger protein XlCOF7.1-like n=1 Tax=Pelobates fuscus TaxID=191477 RepID=UPI002FE45F15